MTTDPVRLAALRALLILDTPPEERFDRITRLARKLLGAPIALIALVDDRRVWFKSRQGLDRPETPVDGSFCARALDRDRLEVPDASLDPRFVANSLVAGPERVRFYAGQVLRSRLGVPVGTLCVMGPQPRRLTADELAALEDLAGVAERELHATDVDFYHDVTRHMEVGLSVFHLDNPADDRTLRYIASNPAGSAFIHKTEEELLGRTMDEVFPHLRDAGLPQFYAEVQRSGEAKSWNHQILDDEGGLVTAFNLNAFPLPGQCVGVVFADVTGRRQAELALERMAFTDVLTGLPNRRMVHDAIGRALGLAKRHGRTIAVLFLDMNGFKKVNDTLGHEIGDLAIQAFAARLSSCVRTSDMVARLGGDEFIVLLSEVAAPDDGADVARKILEAMRPPFDLAGHPATLGAAIGIAEYPGPGEDADTLIKQADAAMYQAKQTKSGYCHWRDVRADSSPA